MATVVSPPTTASDRRVVLPCVSWETYARLLADDEERRVPRLTYDRGVLEIVSPSTPHDEDALTINLLVEIIMATRSIRIRNVGSMTYRREDLGRGFEPDASFYIQHEPHVRERKQIDLTVDPPPDLVLEMEMSRSALNKLALFAAIGIPEVWRCDGTAFAIHVLDGNVYRDAEASTVLPPLTRELLARFLAESRSLPRPEWFHAVSEWARGQRTPDRSID